MILELVLLVVLLGGLLYRWITKSFDKWQKEGVPHDKPSFPNGTHSFLSGKKHLNDFALEDYKKFKMEQGHRVHGWFLMGARPQHQRPRAAEADPGGQDGGQHGQVLPQGRRV